MARGLRDAQSGSAPPAASQDASPAGPPAARAPPRDVRRARRGISALARDAGVRARALGSLLVLAGLAGFLLAPRAYGVTLLFAGLSTGLFLIVVAGTPSVPTAHVPDLLSGPARQLDAVARGLRLQGKAIYVARGESLREDRVFLPASENEKPLPVLDSGTAVHQGPPDVKTGLSLPALGGPVVDAHAEATGFDPSLAPLPEAESFLRGLGLERGLFFGVRVAKDADRLSVSLAPSVATPCIALEMDPPPCERGGCVVCSAVGCVLARSLGRPVAVIEAGPDGDGRVAFAFDAGPIAENPEGAR